MLFFRGNINRQSLSLDRLCSSAMMHSACESALSGVSPCAEMLALPNSEEFSFPQKEL